MSLVWERGPGDPTENSVLLCLADKCNDEGENCFPSIPLLARMSRYSERTVQRALAKLGADGWIEIEQGGGRSKERKGRGIPSQYTVNVAKLKQGKCSVESSEEGCHNVTVSMERRVTLTTKKGDTDDARRVTLTTKKGDTDDNPPHPLYGRTISEPSVNHQGEPERPSPAFPSVGASGEFMAATHLMQELRLVSTVGDIRVMAQVIALESAEHGGTELTMKWLKDRALEALSRGEIVNVFWFKDKKFDRGTQTSAAWEAFVAAGGTRDD
jgi:hypothetical protein